MSCTEPPLVTLVGVAATCLALGALGGLVLVTPVVQLLRAILRRRRRAERDS